MNAIFIPSYKRSKRLLTKKGTLDYIPPEYMDMVHLVVRETEAKDYEKAISRYPEKPMLIVIPHEDYSCKYFGWGETLLWELEYADDLGIDRFLHMDDDLKLTYRPSLTMSMYSELSGNRVLTMLAKLFSCDEEFPVTGILHRGFSSSFTEEEIINHRICSAFCIHMPTLVKNWNFIEKAVQNRHMPDRALFLRFLTEGYKNKVFARFCYDDKPQEEGGCSEFRSAEEHSQSALDLREEFPDLVTTRIKTNLGDERIGTIIQWGKAYKERST
jgi:hypothetical protein